MRILVIEDSGPIRKSLAQGLREAGYAVDEAADGEIGLWHAQSDEHDVIILDLMLPKTDGLAVLKTLRQRRCPAHILILTAKDTAEDVVHGLESGADDYLVKPFHFGELLARIKALIRRRYQTKDTMIRVGDMELDLSGRRVRRGGRRIDLSAKEYVLLEYLALNSGRIVSRTEIWQHVYDVNAVPESNVVDVLVGRVRAKVQSDDKPPLIHTRRGMGYLLSSAADAQEG
jgi:DNA-binding response OmpR family regulator